MSEGVYVRVGAPMIEMTMERAEVAFSPVERLAGQPYKQQQECSLPYLFAAIAKVFLSQSFHVCQWKWKLRELLNAFEANGVGSSGHNVKDLSTKP